MNFFLNHSVESNFGGIFNLRKRIWTAENIKDMALAMIPHAQSYLDENRSGLNGFNRITAEAIIERVLHINAMEFVKRYYS